MGGLQERSGTGGSRLLDDERVGEPSHVFLVKNEIVVDSVEEVELVEGQDVCGNVEDLREGGVRDHWVVPKLDRQNHSVLCAKEKRRQQSLSNLEEASLVWRTSVPREKEIKDVLVGYAAQHLEVTLHVDERCIDRRDRT